MKVGIDMHAESNNELINKSAKVLGILSKKNNLSLFISAKTGLTAEASSSKLTGLSKKVYYTSLKQLISFGLVEKSDGKYVHTTFGSIIYESHVVGLIEQIRNQKQMMMIDTLKHSPQFSEKEIKNFVEKVIGINTHSKDDHHRKIEIVFSYEDMVSAIVERIEFTKNDILLASKYFNEIIINSILRRAKLGINVKVVADKKLVNQFIEQNRKMELDDKNSSERETVITNPWYPGNISRRVGNVPFSMIFFDSNEVGIELINANEPSSFTGTIFIRDEKICKQLLQVYQRLWESASDDLELITETSVSRRYYSNAPRE